MRVRPARRDDAPDISLFIHVMGYEVVPELIAQKLSELGEDHAVLVALVDAHVVGWVHAYIDHTLYGPAIAQLGGLAVDEGRRGEGVGATLMGAAEEWAREAGCHAMWIRSGAQRTEAHEFYRARGYTDLKRQIVIVKALVKDFDDPRLGSPRLGRHDVPPTVRSSTSETR